MAYIFILTQVLSIRCFTPDSFSIFTQALLNIRKIVVNDTTFKSKISLKYITVFAFGKDGAIINKEK